MITAGEFRNGVTFEMDGQVMQVVEFQHVKPGKGAAFVRTKMKNVITGANTSMPHGVPGDTVIREGDFVTLDFGSLKDGY